MSLLAGNFEGIGVQFNIVKDTIVVINTISGGPSEKVGVMSGDRIIKINDSLVAGIKIKNDDVITKLKGVKGSLVKISVYRRNIKQLIDIDIIRDEIPLYSVDASYMIDEIIGFVKISKFSTTTYKEFKKAVMQLQKQGMKKLILDLRGNGGGYMDGAIKIADEFLDDKKLIVYTEGKARPKTVSYATKRGTCQDTDIIIIIDEWSASASEIVAGAIQDNDRGLIIGRRSFGKGLVQEQTVLNDGSAIRLTIARYYTPTGRSIQKPYSDNYDDYIDEIMKRYIHGEFENADSIKFPDSLKFYTPKGNIVYGGGGIMPNIFTPIDTIGWTNYLSEVLNRGLIYQFAFEYVDKNRERLVKFENYQELTEYLDKVHLINQFIVFATDKGVNKNYDEIKKSQTILNAQIKANISRNIFDDAGYYPVIQEIDLVLKKAIDIFQKNLL
jgi:carboxyl-terminal processing protease